MSTRAEIVRFTYRKLAYVRAAAQTGEGKGILATLRKGTGHEPGDMPELFGILLDDMPEEFMSETIQPTKEEWACFTALTLYAMHQQGNDVKTAPMDTEDAVSIGKAMADFALSLKDSNAKKRMAVKLQALASSKDMGEFSYHLRNVIKLLKTKGIRLNYAELAGDIYYYQIPEYKSGVFLKWGQDFYRKMKKENDAEEAKTNE